MEGHALATSGHSIFRPSAISLLARIIPSCRQTTKQYRLLTPQRLLHYNRANLNSDHAGAPQAYPLSGYYSDILSARSSHRGQATTSLSAPEHKPNTPTHETAELPQSPEEKMAIVFGTRLAGPGRSSRDDPRPNTAWKTVNGVPIPPRPQEPDNCCMSGCVHCVWDDYRDEMEEWAAILAQAKSKGDSKSPGVIPGAIPKTPIDMVSTSMDDDGGGSETNWALPGSEDDLFADIPVGIREFMKTEKRLKEIHRQEGASS
ncbi:oxidoreductase-like domain-containing protein [Aspergillus lucknowensis]|uniref:Oxidoreductase-like protein n=1 Tax=Aspergillus lucknowensis TaxID=176173 RepID=A0ABR4LRQ3_9EURO